MDNIRPYENRKCRVNVIFFFFHVTRSIEDCHREGIIVVDFKADNVLIRKRKAKCLYDTCITDHSWTFFKGHGHPAMSRKAGKANFAERFRHYAPEVLNNKVDKSVDIALEMFCKRWPHNLQCLKNCLFLWQQDAKTQPFLRPSIRLAVNDLRKMLQ